MIMALHDKLAVIAAIQRLLKANPDCPDTKVVCEAARLIVTSPIYFS